MVMDEPLDFENEEEEEASFVAVARPTKRKKVIGLDDLLTDYFETGKDELKAKARNSKHGSRGCNPADSDKLLEDNTEDEIKVCKIVEGFEAEVKKMDAREDVPLWGQKIFGRQNPPSIPGDTDVENCQLLQSFSSEEHLGFDLEIEKGEGFLEGLLMDGWLLNMVCITGSVEDSVASWTLNKLLYSSNKKLQDSAAAFWESVLSLDEGDKLPVRLCYFPSYSVLKHAIASYGYLFDTPDTKATSSGSAASDSLGDGPPENIIAWLRVVSASCKVRKVHSIFSPSEAEQLLVIVISLFLARELECLLPILGDCLNSLILYFTVSEWESHCVMAAESIAQRVSMDLNCLRIVDCITGTHDCSKFLRSQLALQLLKISFGLKVASVEKILKLVTSINVKPKAKECDFFQLYVHLVLMDKLLFSTGVCRDKAMVVDSWVNYLRNCSTQIGCTDWRFYATKVRNKASYFLQRVTLKGSANSANTSAR